MHWLTKSFAKLKNGFRKGFCYVFYFCFSLGISQAVFAADTVFYSFNDIKNAQTQLTQLKKQTALPIILPTQIPAPHSGESFYISYSSYYNQPNFNQFWQINVDVTPDCQGARVCNIGLITAEKSGQISAYYQTLPDQKNHLKEKVSISCHISAYYTPFHIAAGAVNPTLEWRQNAVKYTITWRIEGSPAEQKQILLNIAHTGSCR